MSRVNAGQVLLVAVLVATASFALHRMHDEFDRVTDGTLPAMQALEALRFSALRVLSSTSELAFLKAEQAEGQITEDEEAQERVEIVRALEGFDARLGDYRRALARSPTGFPDSAGEIELRGAALAAASAELLSLKEHGASSDRVLAAKETLEDVEQETIALLDQVLARHATELDMRAGVVRRNVQVGYLMVLGCGLLVVLMSMLLGAGLMRRICRPLEQLAQDVASTRRGDGGGIRIPDADMEIAQVATTFGELVSHLDRTTVSRDYLNGILASMSDALIAVDARGRITSCNAAVSGLLGYPPGALEGQHLERLLPASQGLSGDSLLGAVRALADEDGVTCLRSVDGTPRAASVTVSPVREEADGGGGAILLAQDVSALMETQMALREAVDRAQAAAASKSLFLANMSHEIRTPLNGMLGMVELMSAGDLDPRQAHYARMAQRSGEALLSVINDILDFSKVEAGYLQLNEGVFSLTDLVSDIGSMFAESARRKDLELIEDLDPALPQFLSGDMARLRQVLANLVGNAVKFTEVGEVHLSLARIEAAEGRTGLRIEVRDTGIGIPEAAQEHIFESFAQADGSTTRRFGGTGLGLAISASLVSLMGGELRVRSAPDQGSVFWFDVELASAPASAEDAKDFLHALNDARILIVDDNATNRTILSHQLEAWGASCQVAGGGVSALVILRRLIAQAGGIDMVVLDQHMPGMDGLSLAARIRELPEVSDVPLVLLSSVSDQLDEARTAPLRIAGHLTKPVHGRELGNALGAVLAGADAGSAAVPIAPLQGLRGRVLVAEDHPVNQENAREMLGLLGVEAVIVGNGRLAVEAAREGRFDAVLMDWHMPEMDGLEAARCIREAERREGGERRLPIIAVTANALDGDRAACMDAGMDDYVSKPFRLAALTEALRRWLPSVAPSTVEAGDAGSVDDAAVLDDAVLAEIRAMDAMTDGRFGERLFGSFRATAPGDMASIRSAHHAGEPGPLRAAAHALKGASANVGATTLSAVCLEIENAARETRLADASALLERAEIALTATLQAIAHLHEDAA